MHRPESPRRALGLRVVVGWIAVWIGAHAAPAVELLDGRVQIHGYGETQIRTISRDYELDQFDLTQWHLIGNVELELDIAPEGYGPFDLISGFVRVEGRYDCVWNQACGLFRSVNTYGNRADRLPDRLSDARKTLFRGTILPSAVRIDSAGNTRDFSDSRRRISIPLGQDGDEFGAVDPDPALNQFRPVPGRNRVGRLWQFPALGQLFFGQPGLDPRGVDGNRNPIMDPGLGDDDVTGCLTNGPPGAAPCRYAGAYVTERFLDYRFGFGSTRGPTGGQGSTLFGPWRPQDTIIGWAALRDRVNPYNASDEHPVLREAGGITPLRGSGELPFRPAAELSHTADANRDGMVDGDDIPRVDQSQGIYYPSARLAAAIGSSDFDQPKINFDQSELEWNHGYAQEQTHELKEAYVDIEMFDHALWLRAGRQAIVWGKTELFRSQDQFNPQDLGLSSLPSLEESRVPLWALRAIYSLYDVGPFEDVRVEGAFLIDQFQPLDFGRCGEPYSPPQSCLLSAGLFAHGLLGTGLAGQFLPRDPWDDLSDSEGGVRLEWRWKRWSFALTEWYGYPDIPHFEFLQLWERNVDPRSGRPRRSGSLGPCTVGTEFDCFDGGVDASIPTLARPDVEDVLANHHANQQLFAAICASTVGFSTLLPEGCAFSIWNSQELVDAGDTGVPDPTVAIAFSALLRGDTLGKVTLGTLGRFTTDTSVPLGDLTQLPLVTLHANRNLTGPGGPQIDGGNVGFRILAFPDQCGFPPNPALCAPGAWQPSAVSPALSREQEALLGCGDFWGTDCDIFGFDLLNAEGSALVQSWPGFEGSGGNDWDPFDASVAQPGTIGFRGGPACTRFDISTRESLVLPGCRGAVDTMIDPGGVTVVFERGYDPRIDGCIFTDSVGGLPVSGIDQDGGIVDLTDCTTGAGAIAETLFHPFAGCLSPAQELAGLTCTFDTNPLRDYDAEFLAGTAQVFRSEMAALSWNLLMVLVVNSTPPDVLGTGGGFDCDPMAGPRESDDCSDRTPRFDEFDVNDPERLDGCSFRRPFLCKAAGPFLSTTGARRAAVRAGGNDRFGRRDFQWHDGGVAVLRYTRRNVVGFSLDFPEDVTKTNWGMEFTWFDRVTMTNNDELDGVTNTQHFNLSISVDRPTFVRFLNPARTFLFNSQVFLQYIDGYKRGMPANGPFNVLGTFLMATAYHQDRLIPTLTLVHDFSSISGAVITGLTYRFTTHFSVNVGAAMFYGRVQSEQAPIAAVLGDAGGAGRGSNRSYVENGLSSIRDRDELFLRLRYTF